MAEIVFYGNLTDSGKQMVTECLGVHERLWRTQFRRYAFDYVSVAPVTVRVQTQNITKDSPNSRLCSQGWKISWIFWQDTYFGKILEDPSGLVSVFRIVNHRDVLVADATLGGD